MRVESVRFGEFDVPEESVLEFSFGIFGFPHLRRCCLLPYGGTAGLRWIQSLEDPTLLFLSVEPYLVFPEYEAEIPDSEAQALELGSAEEAAVLTLVTVCPETQTVSANLLAPRGHQHEDAAGAASAVGHRPLSDEARNRGRDQGRPSCWC